jgi:uncharacterized membrane protein
VLTLIFVGVTLTGFLPTILLTILAIPFVFFVPGNALVHTIFPGASISKLERFLFTISQAWE